MTASMRSGTSAQIEALWALIVAACLLLLPSDAPGAGADAPPSEEGQGRLDLWDHFSAYEPTYFLYGADPANAKIQFSFRYRILNRGADLPGPLAWLKKMNFAYTQTSLWNLSERSLPFTDTTFNPELQYRDRLLTTGDGPEIHLQAGLAHESNGKAGGDSRSFNIFYVEPEFEWRGSDGFHVVLEPRGWFYVGDQSGNPDIDRFRGHVSMATRLGWREGLETTVLGRVGDGLDKGSVEVNVSYPLSRLMWEGLGLFLHGQFFTGYGESLLHYNEKTTRLRLGVSLLR